MTKTIFALALSLGVGFAFSVPSKVAVDGSTVHSRDYKFSFVNGNLLSNWSFEDDYYGWDGSRYSKKELASITGGSILPVTGSYVGAASASKSMISVSVPVEGGSDYSLSFYVSSTGSSIEKPKVFFYSSKYIFLSETVLSDYPAPNGEWRFYSANVVAPNEARYAKVILSNSNDGVLLFDDVVLEKGSVASNRNSMGVSIKYSDALSHVHMQESLLRRTSPIELIPRKELVGNVVYGKERVEIGARSKVFGGNIGSGDYLFIDNDVTVHDESVPELRIAAKNRIQLGDRDSLYANVHYGETLNWNHQDYVRYSEKLESVGAYDLDFGNVSVGANNVTIKNDSSLTLAPGRYKDVMVRARGTLHLSSGSYYFRKFTLEPTTVLDIDQSQGHVKIYVQSELNIFDNIQMRGDSLSKNFVLWNLNQTSSTRLGTGSQLMGIFVAPKARIELGHRSVLHGAIYAREVFVMHDSRIEAPSFLFEKPQKLYSVTETRYDVLARKYQSDNAYVAELDSEGYVQSSLINANNYYSMQGDGADAGGYAYSEIIYSPKDGHVLKNSVPGAPWNVMSTHAGASYEVFVSDLSIPSSLNFGAHAGNSLYLLSVSKDAENRISMSWKNRLGQIVQEASVVDTVGLDLRNWNWAVKRYEYSREGLLRKVLTPLDTKSGDSLFAIVSEFDGAGREVSRTAPDVGKEAYYYDNNGDIRFTQTAEQRVRNAFTYKELDAQGRIVSVGESVQPLFSDSLLKLVASTGAPVPGVKVEYSGSAYDKLSKCLASIGDASLNTLLSGVNLQNTRGRLACSWTRNPKLYGVLSPSEALVADFFSYNSDGRVSVAYRYTGAERDVSRRLVSKSFTYDDQSVLKKVSVRDAFGVILSERIFNYDEKGRTSVVRDGFGKLLSVYGYDDFGRKNIVNVGNAFRMEYGYHLHGSINSLKAVDLATSNVLYEQHVNYETVEGNVGSPRYDGRVSQVKSMTNTQDTSLLDNNVYIYDMAGNLRTKKGTGGQKSFYYDENGRMLSQEDDSLRLALNYKYKAGSYAVSRATGTNPLDYHRDASRTNNFVYDASGRMLRDSSKGLAISYDMEGMPVLFEQNDSTGLWRDYVVYDPFGWRVATYSFKNNSLVSVRTDIKVDGRKELERRKVFVGNDSSVTEYTMLYGNGGVLGRRHADGSYEWYVKDRQGSLVMSLVGVNMASVLAYEPYGYLHLSRVSGDVPAEQYTGKEYDDRLELSYFGARYFDPLLAMWLTPDPARQYLNPYSYGGDPINVIDLDGRFGLSALVPGLSVISAIYSASTSSESVGEWFGTFALDLLGNNLGAAIEPVVTVASIAWGAVSTVGAFGRAVTGNGNWGDVLTPISVSIFSSFESDVNSVYNSFAALGRGDVGEFFTNLSSSGVNALATDYYAFQYSTNKGFGSQKYTYEFSVEGPGGHRNIVWGQPTNDLGTVNAENFGQNIALFKSYYDKDDDEKRRILRHEFVHARQESKYGLGGMIIRKLYREKTLPTGDDCGMFGYSCEDIKKVYRTYNNNGTLDYAEIEAEVNANAGEDSEYWFDAPVFY